MGNRDIRSVEGRGMGWGTRGIQDGRHRDFHDLTRQGSFGKDGMEFEGCGIMGKERSWFWMGEDKRWW